MEVDEAPQPSAATSPVMSNDTAAPSSSSTTPGSVASAATRKKKKKPQSSSTSSTPSIHNDNDDNPSSPAATTTAATSPTPSSSTTPATTETSTTTKTKRKSSSGGATTNSCLPLSKSYVDLIHDAIVALKDRTGSSTVALTKWMHAHYPEVTESPQFKRHFQSALKTGLKNERFVKVRSSFKISPVWKEREKQAKSKKKKERQQATAAVSKKPLSLEETQRRNAAKLAKLQAKMTPDELAKEKEKMDRQEAAQRKAVELELKAKERADRLKRRRYPMEDSKLHAEDKELNVKQPADVITRPYLPYFFNLTRSMNDSSRFGKTPDKILASSKVDGLDTGSFGLVPDLLQVYHFFRGDVHFTGDDPHVPVVADFSLQHLVYSVEQILYGQAKSFRLLPPLISHLFVTCLSILCGPPPAIPTEGMSKNELQLKRDLHKYLAPALTPASWADICFLYMDAMERYATTDASRDPNVLPCLNTDIAYLLGIAAQPTVSMTPFVKRDTETDAGNTASSMPLPDGYKGYLGDSQGALYRAHFKLARQDPWNLSADEIMALLRALTDDILATHPTVGRDIAAREEEMQSLLKAKRAADAKFRQVRLAFEGPKKAVPKKVVADEEKKDDETSKVVAATTGDEPEDETNGKQEKSDDSFKPTVSKRQFETTKKLQQKASDAYEKGIRKLVARTEPIGYDRNFNAVYCFRHDPEFLYVEDLRSPSSIATHLPLEMQIPRRSWHVIETTSLFDLFTSSLDIRGKREHDLYEEMVGQGPQQSLRRFLYDDVKEREGASNMMKAKETLLQRLDSARLKCDEEIGRRSGRLAGAAEEELAEVEKEIAALENKMEGNTESEAELDYEQLTGLELLRKFDKRRGIDTRRSREKRAASGSQVVARCSKLVPSGNIDGTGLVGIIVKDLLELEEHCEKLSPWEKKGVDHRSWISKLENAVHAWNEASTVVVAAPNIAPTRASIGSSGDSSPFIKRGQPMDEMESALKRQRISSPQQTSSSVAPTIPAIIAMIRQPLLELEERIADMTNLAVMTSDVALADENMSVDESSSDNLRDEKMDRQWKRLVFQASQTLNRKHVMIRDLILAAMAAARKAHLPDVVARLRVSLLKNHTGAAGECKAAAFQVLEDYGGYEDDTGSDDEDDHDDKEESTDDDQDAIPSVMSAEAAFLASSLSGDADASRDDWIESVKSCKTVSRLASLVAGFAHDASARVTKLEIEHNDLLHALTRWEKEIERQGKNKAKNSSSFSGPSEVWADVSISDDIVMVKAESYPWWPAKKCVSKDPELSARLNKLNKSLVSLIGERGDLRVVDNDGIKPFTGSVLEEDDDFEASKEVRSQLDDCLAISRRIIRGREKMRS